jgi:hypothetical protein
MSAMTTAIAGRETIALSWFIDASFVGPGRVIAFTVPETGGGEVFGMK